MYFKSDILNMLIRANDITRGEVLVFLRKKQT